MFSPTLLHGQVYKGTTCYYFVLFCVNHYKQLFFIFLYPEELRKHFKF